MKDEFDGIEFDDYEDTQTNCSEAVICRCAQCGYNIYEYEDAVIITATGDTIHRQCWEDYANDNACEFMEPAAI